MGSVTISPAAVAAALNAVRREAGDGRWHTSSALQRDLLDSMGPFMVAAEQVPGVSANATRDAEEHRRFLASHGWEAELPLGNAMNQQIYVAGLLDALMKWLIKGERRPILVPDLMQNRPGFILKNGVRLYGVQGQVDIFEISTQSGGRVLVTESPRQPEGWVELIDLAENIFGPALADSSFDDWADISAVGLKMPMVDLSDQHSLAELIGMTFVSDETGSWPISEALYQGTLKMNERGVQARAKVELRLLKGGDGSFVINRPFLLHMTQRFGQVEVPLFTAYVDYGAWKDPGEF